MNPCVLIATHQRIGITSINIACVQACGASVILVVSDIAEEKTFRLKFPGITIILHSNYPLGSKWQAGVDLAMALNADPLIINGSDDILSPEYFTKVREMTSRGYDFIGLSEWYAFDNIENMYHFRYLRQIPLGGGRAYSKKLLDKAGWKLFDEKLNKGLDSFGFHRARKSKLKQIILDSPLILSIKGDWQTMNPLDKILNGRNAKMIEKIAKYRRVLEEFKI